MDLRTEKTERSILTAFSGLRAQKPLEKITVKELCEKAWINKSTFYAHYTDLYDLSDRVEAGVVKSILENIPHPEYLFIKPREFTRELHAAYGSQGALLGILFSGAQSGKLIGRLERDLKTMIFDACPQYREDPAAGILFSYGVYGGYYALTSNRDCSEDEILEIIGEAAQRIAGMLRQP